MYVSKSALPSSWRTTTSFGFSSFSNTVALRATTDDSLHARSCGPSWRHDCRLQRILRDGEAIKVAGAPMPICKADSEKVQFNRITVGLCELVVRVPLLAGSLSTPDKATPTRARVKNEPMPLRLISIIVLSIVLLKTTARGGEAHYVLFQPHHVDK